MEMTETGTTDEVLLARYARTGDGDALGTLVARRWAEAYRTALAALGEPGAAEDAAQETFVAIARRARSFRDSNAFGPWFGAILANAIRMSRRASRRRERRES